MPTYKVTAVEQIFITYQIEAIDPDEAREKVVTGDHDYTVLREDGGDQYVESVQDMETNITYHV